MLAKWSQEKLVADIFELSKRKTIPRVRQPLVGGQRDAVPPPYSEDIPLRLAMRPARSRCAFVRRNCLIFPECTASESDGGDSEEEGTVAEGASAECEGKPRPKSQAAKEILYANTSYLWLSRVKIPLRVTL